MSAPDSPNTPSRACCRSFYSLASTSSHHDSPSPQTTPGAIRASEQYDEGMANEEHLARFKRRCPVRMGQAGSSEVRSGSAKTPPGSARLILIMLYGNKRTVSDCLSPSDVRAPPRRRQAELSPFGLAYANYVV